MVSNQPQRRPAALTDLQERVARMLARLPEGEGFALAGGAALIVRGDVERLTRDLDFFAPPGRTVDRLVAAVFAAARDEAMRVEMSQVSATFARLIVYRGDDAVPVDLGIDAASVPSRPVRSARALR